MTGARDSTQHLGPPTHPALFFPLNIVQDMKLEQSNEKGHLCLLTAIYGGGSLDIYRPISASPISVFIAAWEKGDGKREGMDKKLL